MSSELNCLCAGSATHFTPTVQRAPCPTDEHNSSFERQLKNINAQKLRFACTGIWKNVQDKEGHLRGLRDDTKTGTLKYGEKRVNLLRDNMCACN